MQFELDFRSRQPIYIQIVEQVRQRVARGELQPGDQLPTVRQLAADLRVNFNTVARAYRLLDEAGLISTQHGRGTYVWERPSPEVTQHLRSQSLREMSEQFVQEALGLGYTAEEIAGEIDNEIEKELTDKNK
jgi:GntR family transcriptional regulator